MFKHRHTVLVVFCILSILLTSASAPIATVQWQSKVDPWVLQTASAGDTEFLIYLSAQADLSGAKLLSTKLEKGDYVYRTLTALAESTQAPVLAELQKLGLDYRSYWIANMIWVRGDIRDIQLLAERLDVGHLYANPSVSLVAPIEQSTSTARLEGFEWNIVRVNAPQVWALGYTGQGVVIGGQDTGYVWDHPALKNHYRGWDGVNIDHNYNWFDATSSSSDVPIDPYGHGTHTMGIMVGDDGGLNQIGMAPGAQWIGCRNMDADGVGSPETYTACYQWFLAPTLMDGSQSRTDLAPDVINNSWSCPTSEGCNPASLLIPVQNLVAAGIVTAHSAGNSGSACETIAAPAAIYEESFTVGATTLSDTIASFSSRGPVTIDQSNRPKPDISAPGVGIRSSVPGGYSLMSGTSMAAPHVAGLVALLISAQPAMRGHVDQIEAIIQETALHIPDSTCSSTGVPNNTYGWGRIDALSAVQALQKIELKKAASALTVAPGDLITYTLSITHSTGMSATSHVVLTDTIPTGSIFIKATQPYSQVDRTIRWDFSTLESMGTRSVEMVVQALFTPTFSISNDDYAVRSDQVAQVHGEPVVTLVKYPHQLELSKVASKAIVQPGDPITYTLTITHPTGILPTTNVVLTDTIPTNSTFITATLPYTVCNGVIRWDFPALDALSTRSVELVVRVNNTSVVGITNNDYAVLSDQVAMVRGTPVMTPIRLHYYFPVFYSPEPVY